MVDTKWMTRKRSRKPEERKVVNVPLENELANQIEEFRYTHRVPTMVGTIKALIRLGLQTDTKRKPHSGGK